ncbi:MAG: hypothetical protein Q9168_007543 [Polycauliona sp. 1 TL-2023]
MDEAGSRKQVRTQLPSYINYLIHQPVLKYAFTTTDSPDTICSVAVRNAFQSDRTEKDQGELGALAANKVNVWNDRVEDVMRILVHQKILAGLNEALSPEEARPAVRQSQDMLQAELTNVILKATHWHEDIGRVKSAVWIPADDPFGGDQPDRSGNFDDTNAKFWHRWAARRERILRGPKDHRYGDGAESVFDGSFLQTLLGT